MALFTPSPNCPRHDSTKVKHGILPVPFSQCHGFDGDGSDSPQAPTLTQGSAAVFLLPRKGTRMHTSTLHGQRSPRPHVSTLTHSSPEWLHRMNSHAQSSHPGIHPCGQEERDESWQRKTVRVQFRHSSDRGKSHNKKTRNSSSPVGVA